MAEAPAPAAPPPAGESRLRSRYRRRSLSRDDANSAVSLAARWRRHTVAVRPRHHNKVEAEAELDGPLPTVFKEVETAKAALVNDTGEAWARFESCVSPHVRTALPPAAWSVLEEAVSGALDAVRLKAGDALTDLAESCKQRARMQLKEQAANFESKLETARRASYVRVENAHAEDSFKLQKAVKEKEQQMLNDDTALQEARQQLGVVTAALEEQIGLRANFEGALAAANKALSSAEHRAADAEAKVHELVEDRARLSVLLDDDRLEELKVTRTEQQRTLGDRLACVQAALVFANEERDEARYALDSVEERARLQLAKQLAEELEPMRAELASSNAKCAMLKGALANLGEDFKASKQRLEEERAAKLRLEEELLALREELLAERDALLDARSERDQLVEQLGRANMEITRLEYAGAQVKQLEADLLRVTKERDVADAEANHLSQELEAERKKVNELAHQNEEGQRLRASLSEGLEVARGRVGELEAELEATKASLNKAMSSLREDGSATLKDGAVDALREAAKRWEDEAMQYKAEVEKERGLRAEMLDLERAAMARAEAEAAVKAAAHQAELRKQEAATAELLAQQERKQQKMLEEAVGELRGEMDRRVNEWKDEAQRLKEAWKAEIVQNKGIVLSTLHAMKDVTTPQAKEMGEKRSLSKLVTLITDKALGLQYNLELSRKELSSTHDALWKLRDQMEAMAKESRDALEQVEKAHTSERSSLVTSAISSLQHLRSHLTEQALKQSGAQTERRPWIHLEKLNTPSPPTMARKLSKPSPVKLRGKHHPVVPAFPVVVPVCEPPSPDDLKPPPPNRPNSPTDYDGSSIESSTHAGQHYSGPASPPMKPREALLPELSGLPQGPNPSPEPARAPPAPRTRVRDILEEGVPSLMPPARSEPPSNLPTYRRSGGRLHGSAMSQAAKSARELGAGTGVRERVSVRGR